MKEIVTSVAELIGGIAWMARWYALAIAAIVAALCLGICLSVIICQRAERQNLIATLAKSSSPITHLTSELTYIRTSDELEANVLVAEFVRTNVSVTVVERYAVDSREMRQLMVGDRSLAEIANSARASTGYFLLTCPTVLR